MEYRTLGRTGARVSILGFGGTGVAMRNYLSEWDPDVSRDESIAAIRRAVALGVNYFDTAPLYGRGNSEELFGEALQPHRESVFLATKLRESSADDVQRSIDDSLKRLRTDSLDPVQYHGEWITDDLLEVAATPGAFSAAPWTTLQRIRSRPLSEHSRTVARSPSTRPGSTDGWCHRPPSRSRTAAVRPGSCLSGSWSPRHRDGR